MLHNNTSHNNPDSFPQSMLADWQTIHYQPQAYLPNSSPDFMHQTVPYCRPPSVVSGIWDGRLRHSSITLTGLVGDAPTQTRSTAPSRTRVTSTNTQISFWAENALPRWSTCAGEVPRGGCPTHDELESPYAGRQADPETEDEEEAPLVLELRIPSRLLCPYKPEPEMTHSW